MSKKKTAHKPAPPQARKKSAALESFYPATMTEFGQIFKNNGNMETFMNQGKTQFDKFAAEAGTVSRDGFEAANKAMGIFAKGFEDLVRTSIAIAQESAEKQGQMVKEAMTTKSLNEWADIQNRIAQTNFDDCIAAVTKISELGVKLVSEASAPLNTQMTKGMKKASEAFAA